MVRQLVDILEEKIKKVKGKASLGRMLGVSGEAILSYTKGNSMPSLALAIKWKEVFGENLISLMFEEPTHTGVQEPSATYGLQADLNECRKKLIACMEEKEQLRKGVSKTLSKSKPWKK
ncbi:MAG: hypothetical protein ACK5WF_17935 [Cyclobacteriaceae bacterium]